MHFINILINILINKIKILINILINKILDDSNINAEK